MTVKQISIGNWVGLSTDTKPTEISLRSTFLEMDTGDRFITHDGGVSWNILSDLVEAGVGRNPKQVNITTSSSTILAANTRRKSVIICNDSDAVIYLSIGKIAVKHKGIRLKVDGEPFIISRSGEVFTTEAIRGIHDGSGSKVVTAQELQ